VIVIATELISVDAVVNGRRVVASVEARMSLSDFLRHRLGLTGTHVGCEQGVCGSCNVLVHGVAVRSCLLFATQVDGQIVTTVEGLEDIPGIERAREAFIAEEAFQCGFCTPGFLVALAEVEFRPGEAGVTDLRSFLSGTLCRCTGYQTILKAVRRLG
jgi:aerobic-type carbon monoxide dehydrogenase small subunit (CoxS/CutS family)